MSQGYIIRLIGPSGYCLDQEGAWRGIKRLAEQGHVIQGQEVVTRRFQRFAGTDQQRLNDINQFASSSALPDIVIPLRGGYGISVLLDKIDYAKLKQRLTPHPIIFCGHSDFTALQLALLSQCQLITFSGPMLAGNFGAAILSNYTLDNFWNLITSSSHTITWQPSYSGSSTGEWQGKLWGGNLCMLVSLIGTPWFPEVEGGILFIEEVNEHPYRIERMLLQLHYAGVLAKQKAIVMGSFTAATPNSYDGGYSLETVWNHLRKTTGIPIITGLAYGHEADTVTLPIGAQVRLSAKNRTCQIVLTDYPHLPNKTSS